MKTLATLAGKETRALFASPIAYAVIAVFLVLMGYTFTLTLFISKQATLVLASGDIMDAHSQVTRVWIDGAPQSLETRHTRLYQEFKDRK